MSKGPLSAAAWNAFRAMSSHLTERLSRTITGGHYFLMGGEAQAREACDHIVSLIDEIAELKNELNRNLR